MTLTSIKHFISTYCNLEHAVAKYKHLKTLSIMHWKAIESLIVWRGLNMQNLRRQLPRRCHPQPLLYLTLWRSCLKQSLIPSVTPVPRRLLSLTQHPVQRHPAFHFHFICCLTPAFTLIQFPSASSAACAIHSASCTGVTMATGK